MRTQNPTTKWFIEAKTLEDLKVLYRKLAFTHHPDHGGNTATMQEINAEYDYRRKLLEMGQSWKSNNSWDKRSNQNSNPGSSSYNQKSNKSNSNTNNNESGNYQNYRSYSPPPPPPSSEKPNPKDAQEAFEKAFAYASKSNPYFHVVMSKDGEVIAYGRTYQHRDFLRETGFWWDDVRRCWHFVRKPFSPYDQDW